MRAGIVPNIDVTTYVRYGDDYVSMRGDYQRTKEQKLRNMIVEYAIKSPE